MIYSESQQKIIKRDQFRSDMEKLRQHQEMWRERNRREIEEENERINEYHRKNEEQVKSAKQIEIEKRKKDEELRDRMCSTLDEIEVS